MHQTGIGLDEASPHPKFSLLKWLLLFSVCIVLNFFIKFYSEDRQFRVEHREGDGSIKGEHGYVDKDSKIELTVGGRKI